jgi:hypothetical protein
VRVKFTFARVVMMCVDPSAARVRCVALFCVDMDSEPLQGFAAGRLAPCTSPKSHGIGVLPHARNLLSLLAVHTSRTVWLQKEEICFYPHLLSLLLFSQTMQVASPSLDVSSRFSAPGPEGHDVM